MKKSKIKKHKVYFVGAGPAEFDLITIRGAKVLACADTVIYDYLLEGSLLQQAKEGAELISAGKFAKKGKYSKGSKPQQHKINNLIIKKVKEGRKVVRLKNGCLSLFSRISQELDALTREGIDFELIGGVTAAEAAASVLKIPLTERTTASSSVFVTGHQAKSKNKNLLDWPALAKMPTIVLYMGVKDLKQVTTKIIKNGRDKKTAAIAIGDISTPAQKIISSSLEKISRDAKKKKLKPPAIVIIGEVCNLYQKFNQNNKKKVLFTGLSKERFFLSRKFHHLPLIEIRPLENYTGFDNYLQNIEDFDWLIFTSRYGVKYFFARFMKVKNDLRDLSGIKIAAIGGSTKNKLIKFGINPDLVPKKESSLGLIKAFKKINLKNKKLLLPRSNISDKGLTLKFKQRGAKVEEPVAYQNLAPKKLPPINWQNFQRIFFTSPSGVRNFKNKYKKVPKSVKISCVGDVTKKEAKKWNFLK